MNHRGRAPLALRLDVGAGMGTASVLRLTAPSPSATDDVLLADLAVAADGSWRAPVRTERIAARAGALALELAPSSAVLLTVSPKRAATRRHHGVTGR